MGKRLLKTWVNMLLSDTENTKYRIYADCETNGLSYWRNDVISLALIVADNDMNILGKFSENATCRIDKWWSDDAEKIHGFTKQQVRGFQSQRSMCINVLNFLKPFKDDNNVPQLFISHSLGQFDYRFIEIMFRKLELQWSLWKVLDQSKQRSTITEGRARGYKINKLDEWAKRLGFDLDHHLAESDVMCCYEIDKFLLKEL